MTMRSGKSNSLPEGFNPCSACANDGKHAYTRICAKTGEENGSSKLILTHWCDQGRPLTSTEVFRKGGPDAYAQINLITQENGKISDLMKTWNAMNRTKN